MCSLVVVLCAHVMSVFLCQHDNTFDKNMKVIYMKICGINGHCYKTN